MRKSLLLTTTILAACSSQEVAVQPASAAPVARSAPAPTVDVPDFTCQEKTTPCYATILKTKSSSYTGVKIETVDLTARAGVDYTPVSTTVTLGNNTTSYKLPIGIINNSVYEGDKKFALRVTITRNGLLKGSYTPPTATITDDELPPPPPVQCPDGSTVPAGQTCPTGGLAGAPAIDDNFDYAQALEPTQYGPDGRGGIPPLGRTDDLGAFRFVCLAGQILKDDPIVYPGQRGASPHWHQFIGNTGADGTSTHETLRTTGGSTCDNHGKPWAINRSSYWTSAMLDGAGHFVQPDYVQVYYKRFPLNGPGCVGPAAIGICTDLPNGLRFIFGYNMKTMTGGPTGEGTRDYWSMSYSCEPSKAVPNPPSTGIHYHTIADVAKAGCPIGAYLTVKLDAPECWNGHDLDTPDHRSHMVYAPDGTDKGMGYVCPSTHPYVIPLISYFWNYSVDANFQKGLWEFDCDRQMRESGMPVAAGTCLHMDYFEAWSPRAKAEWQLTCINGPRSCSSGDMGDGTAIIEAGEPAEGFPSHILVNVPSQ